MNHLSLLIMILCMTASIDANQCSLDATPVSYKGRIRPMEVYCALWLQDFCKNSEFLPIHQKKIPSLKANAPPRDGSSSNMTTFISSTMGLDNYNFEFIWCLHLMGHSLWDDVPLFSIKNSDVKNYLHLPHQGTHFCFNDLKTKIPFLQDPKSHLSALAVSELRELSARMGVYFNLEGSPSREEVEYEACLLTLQRQRIPPFELARQLEVKYPLLERLRNAGTLIPALPSKYSPCEWFSLASLKVRTFDPNTQSLTFVRNFTEFSDEDFFNIQEAYLEGDREKLAQVLKHAYLSLEGKPYHEAAGKSLYYPTQRQLFAELILFRYPWIELCMIGYILSLVFFLFPKNRFVNIGLFFLSSTFLLHTFLLAARCYILQRPPVSNMFETVLYVPWVAVLSSYLFYLIFKSRLLLISSCGLSIILIALIKLSKMDDQLENVQAVLDSQLWLVIHVLMVVGSYAAFLLSGILGHIYLIGTFHDQKETPFSQVTAKYILQSIYLGLMLLIPGTILGGVWAAESWGRFWDWDPKESWAFISACIYVAIVHAYTFKHIKNFGLATGSIIGVLAISFTWYGVNYILGTGLHSYGFGNGGEVYYYIYVVAEILFFSVIFFNNPKGLISSMIEKKVKNC